MSNFKKLVESVVNDKTRRLDEGKWRGAPKESPNHSTITRAGFKHVGTHVSDEDHEDKHYDVHFEYKHPDGRKLRHNVTSRFGGKQEHAFSVDGKHHDNLASALSKPVKEADDRLDESGRGGYYVYSTQGPHAGHAILSGQKPEHAHFDHTQADHEEGRIMAHHDGQGNWHEVDKEGNKLRKVSAPKKLDYSQHESIEDRVDEGTNHADNLRRHLKRAGYEHEGGNDATTAHFKGDHRVYVTGGKDKFEVEHSIDGGKTYHDATADEIKKISKGGITEGLLDIFKKKTPKGPSEDRLKRATMDKDEKAAARDWDPQNPKADALNRKRRINEDGSEEILDEELEVETNEDTLENAEYARFDEMIHYDNKRPDSDISHYEIWNRKTSTKVGKATTKTGARNAVDRHDNKYGGYAHFAKAVYKTNEEKEPEAPEGSGNKDKDKPKDKTKPHDDLGAADRRAGNFGLGASPNQHQRTLMHQFNSLGSLSK